MPEGAVSTSHRLLPCVGLPHPQQHHTGHRPFLAQPFDSMTCWSTALSSLSCQVPSWGFRGLPGCPFSVFWAAPYLPRPSWGLPSP